MDVDVVVADWSARLVGRKKLENEPCEWDVEALSLQFSGISQKTGIYTNLLKYLQLYSVYYTFWI